MKTGGALGLGSDLLGYEILAILADMSAWVKFDTCSEGGIAGLNKNQTQTAGPTVRQVSTLQLSVL